MLRPAASLVALPPATAALSAVPAAVQPRGQAGASWDRPWRGATGAASRSWLPGGRGPEGGGGGGSWLLPPVPRPGEAPAGPPSASSSFPPPLHPPPAPAAPPAGPGTTAASLAPGAPWSGSEPAAAGFSSFV